MEKLEKQGIRDAFIKEFGFLPPCQAGAPELGEEMGDIMSRYHHVIWGEGVIPLKYRYLIALATAVYGNEERRARLELLKAVKNGAEKEEILEVFRQQVWMRGAPVIPFLMPLLKFLEQLEKKQKDGKSA